MAAEVNMAGVVNMVAAVSITTDSITDKIVTAPLFAEGLFC
jgi:hypothetical protein